MRRITSGISRWWAGSSLFRADKVARFSTTAYFLEQSSQHAQPPQRGNPTNNQDSDAGNEHQEIRGDGARQARTPAHGSASHFSSDTNTAGQAADATSAPKGPMDEKEDISVTGPKGEPVSITSVATFAELKDLPDWLTEGVRQLGFTTPSVIQKFTIPALQQGHDIIGLAPTGSGKTVAFAIPALQQLQASRSGSPSVLVLAPTRELVQQTTKVFEKLSGGRARVAEAYGGEPREIQARKLHRGCDVLVACPGRLKDFLDSGHVSLSSLSFLVFDEADRLLDMGFQTQLADILSYVEPTQQVQRMMWSATWPDAVQDLARTYMSAERLLIRAGTAGTGAQVNEHIKQRVLFADGFVDRMDKLVGLIESGEIDDNTAKLIIFVERQTDTDEVAHGLSRRLGIDSRYVGVLHGGLSQRRRDLVMNDFKSNRIRILVATDVASRGLDIPDVTCVINFQAPQNIDSYCHRIGRTGRAGRKGDAYTFVGRQDGGISTELIDYLRRCKMDVPPALTELEARHTEESRYRRRPSRGGNDRYRNGGNYRGGGGGSRGRFGAASSSYGRGNRDASFGSRGGYSKEWQRAGESYGSGGGGSYNSGRAGGSSRPPGRTLEDDNNGWM